MGTPFVFNTDISITDPCLATQILPLSPSTIADLNTTVSGSPDSTEF